MRSFELGVVVLISALVACSDNETRAPAGSSGTTTAAAGGTGGGGSNVGAGGTIIPDTPCDDVSPMAVVVYPSSASMHLEQLEPVGNRWAASGFEGFVYFDRDGSNADSTPRQLAPNWNRITAEGANLGVAASTNAALQYQRFDADGVAVTGPRGMDVLSPVGVSLAHDAGTTLVAWGFSTRLYARGIQADGIVASDRFQIAQGGFSSLLFVRTAAREGQFAVVWTGDATLGVPETFVAIADLTSALGEPKRIFAEGKSHELVDVTATDTGYAVMLTGEAPDFTPVLVTLDASGEVQSTGILEGAKFAYALTWLGDTLAVVSGRSTGELQVRGFTEQLDPVGPWKCVGKAYDDAFPPAIGADDMGAAALFTRPDGSVALNRVATLSE